MLPAKAVARRSIVVAAIAAILVGEMLYTRRKEQYLHLAQRHRSQAAPLDEQSAPEIAFRRYHLERARQYERAAYRPWLRVTP